MNRISATLLLACSALCLAQAPGGGAKNSNAPRQSNKDELLAKPVDWNEHQAHIFKGSSAIMVFRLATSWIPGEDHKGMLRYKLSAYPKKPTTDAEMAQETTLDTPEHVEMFVSRVSRCQIFLDLFDADGFQLRRDPVPLDLGVDQNARLQALTANKSAQMDADEYRMLIGDGKTSGSYGISWNCNVP